MAAKRGTGKGIANQKAFGDAILARLDGAPAALKAPGKAFAEVHKQFVAGDTAATQARDARDDALLKVKEADDVLDIAVLALADALVAAGLGTRIKPLASFTKFAPSKLVELSYASEVAEVKKMLAAIRKKKLPAALKSQCAVCDKKASIVSEKLAAVSAPQAAYSQAMTARDALLPLWQKRLDTLRKHAAVAYDDDPALAKALFAPPDAVQAPRKRRAHGAARAAAGGRKKAAAKGAQKTPSAAPPAGGSGDGDGSDDDDPESSG